MDIRKWSEKYSRDIELVYNSKSTKDNYKSQTTSFLNFFKNEVEPKFYSGERNTKCHNGGSKINY